MAKRYYELHVSGCTRHLPVLNISDKVAIAGFVILGDVEIVENTARFGGESAERLRIRHDGGNERNPPCR